jgi:NAD(P)-dependent dehydrogenase (short-subunit alcohol dehydrogenase family)
MSAVAGVPELSNPEFAGKVVLITGAATGIGRASALAFGRAGAKVVVADIAEADGSKTASDIAAAGGEARFIKVDVADGAAVENMVRQTVAWYGRLDCALNNAGTILQEVSIADMDESAWERVLAVNLKGVFLCMKHEIRQMLAQGAGGTIVNTTSTTALRTVLNSAAYSSSKAGIIALTRIGAAENGPLGIRINAIAPAGIETPMLLKGLGDDEERRRNVSKTRVLRRLGSPEEAAEAVLWLSSPRSSYITGHTLAVDGGVLAAP